MTKSFPPHVGRARMSPTTETWFTGLSPAVLSTAFASLLTVGAVTGCHDTHRSGAETSGAQQTSQTGRSKQPGQTSRARLARLNGSRPIGPDAILDGPGPAPKGGSEVLELRRPRLSSPASPRENGRFYRGENLICTFWLSAFTAPGRHIHLQSLLRLVGPKGRVLLEKGPATLVDQAIPAGRSMHRVQMRLTVALSNVEPAGKHRLWITIIEPATKRYGRLPVDFVVEGTNRPVQTRFTMERVRFSTPADLRPGGMMHISGILLGLRSQDERPTAKPGHPRWRIRLDAIVQVADRASHRTTLHRLKVVDDLLAFAPTFFPLELDVPMPTGQPPARYDVKIQIRDLIGKQVLHLAHSVEVAPAGFGIYGLRVTGPGGVCLARFHRRQRIVARFELWGFGRPADVTGDVAIEGPKGGVYVLHKNAVRFHEAPTIQAKAGAQLQGKQSQPKVSQWSIPMVVPEFAPTGTYRIRLRFLDHRTHRQAERTMPFMIAGKPLAPLPHLQLTKLLVGPETKGAVQLITVLRQGDDVPVAAVFGGMHIDSRPPLDYSMNARMNISVRALDGKLLAQNRDVATLAQTFHFIPRRLRLRATWRVPDTISGLVLLQVEVADQLSNRVSMRQRKILIRKR
ncbi:MAG: hypothetical protein J7M25_03900 [Deltaproteobacteria bacterium]|nr:hypothetical protein [Deltaproteobacteria bacterium]